MIDLPDGIRDAGASKGLWDRHSSAISFLILGALLLAGLSGILGGRTGPPKEAGFEAASLSITAPFILRNGEVFETQIRVRAAEPLENLTLGVSADLWRDMTINTMLPAAEAESFKDGRFRLSYGPMKAGEVFLVKLGGQINSPMFGSTHGRVALYDGERLLGDMPLKFDVRP